MRRRKHKRNKPLKFHFNIRWFIWIGFVLCAAAFLFGLGYTFYNAKVFQIHDEDIQSNTDVGKAARDFLRDKSLFKVELEQVASLIMKEHPEYKKIRIRKLFPRTVRIDIDKREVFAQIKGRQFYPVDQEGVVLSNGSSEALAGLIPIEIQPESGYWHTGYRIDNENLAAAFELIESLQRQDFFTDFSVNLVNIVNQQNMYFLMQTRDKGQGEQFSSKLIKVIVGEADVSGRVKILLTLLQGELRDKLKLVKYIDLRHKKIYVGFRR